MTEVHLAIYDLSMGMARNLSTQFLGPQHTIDIIPHTGLVVYGREYFFGRGIEWCTPEEFRASRGIHPVEVKLLGRTTTSRSEFEAWCLEQGRNGMFGVESYDLLSRNCNNFCQEAAIHGLRLSNGIPQWILDVPSKFLSSPMGMMMRPILEGMQLTNNAPTNAIRYGGAEAAGVHSVQHRAPPVLSANASAVNPWANLSSASNATLQEEEKVIVEGTPVLDKQTGPLLSTETGVVPACIAKLVAKQDDLPHSSRVNREEEQTSKLLTKLADPKASWTQGELQIVHQHLRSFIQHGVHLSFALMLLRLAVLKHPSCETPNREQCISTQLVAELLLAEDGENKLSLANQSMAFCVLSNAIGSNNEAPTWTRKKDGSGDSDMFLQAIDRALRCGDPTVDGSSSMAHVSLRQSAVAFLYNVARKVAEDGGNGGTEELSEAAMSILIGCIENIGEEKDVTTLKRRFLCLGQLLKSRKFGKTAAGLVGDLGLVDDGFCIAATDQDVNCLAKEVASLLSICKDDA
ncbi:hypothetical protein HJC23_004021 [Cyclotella cryptica]|uniref:PPPDE domain-containing protein n=1 Tax=Cyclotella cryptica TaxID=29204 RepID=A0ABD3QU03_9STRA|eukprot:CCRYP_002014-RA/>CCRYP_002014-RA protein AED:0.01 eAED:-0.01 QI:0/-1/0/1/-1/1/1/0/518